MSSESVMPALNTMFNRMSNTAFNNILFNGGTIGCMADADMHPTMARLYEAASTLRGIAGQSNLADALNESPQTLNNWERRGISKRGALAAAQVIGCNPQWIISGAGGMGPRALFSADLQARLAGMDDAELARCENMLRAHLGMDALLNPKPQPNGMGGERLAA